MNSRLALTGTVLVLVASSLGASAYHITGSVGPLGSSHQWNASTAIPDLTSPGAILFATTICEQDDFLGLGSPFPIMATPGMGGLCFMSPGYGMVGGSCVPTDWRSNGLAPDYAGGGSCLAGTGPFPSPSFPYEDWFTVQMLDWMGNPVPFVGGIDGRYACYPETSFTYDAQLAYTSDDGHVTGFPTVFAGELAPGFPNPLALGSYSIAPSWGPGTDLCVAAPGPECSNGVDDADPEDLTADYPWDPGCSSPTDDDETDEGAPYPECSDLFDNDRDLLIDTSDPDCWEDPRNPATYNPWDDDESAGQCRDNIDNDFNGAADAADSGCWTNPDDPLSYDPFDPEESSPECRDRIDNDGNSLSDRNDPGCWTVSTDPSTYDPNDPDESSTECSDNLDNDGDGTRDRGDSNCWVNPANPTSYDPNDDREDPSTPCGPSTLQIQATQGTHGNADYDYTVVIRFTPGAHRVLTAESIAQTGGPSGGYWYHTHSGTTHIWETHGPDYQIREFEYLFTTACEAPFVGTGETFTDRYWQYN